MDVELRHLRVFAAVATHLSYTAASRELLVAQPALTRTIQQLEGALGVRLLKRTSRSVQLTDVGRRFLNHTLSVLADLDRAILAVRDQQELRVGFQWVLPEPWATKTITRFEKATGATVILLRRDDIATDLERGDLDLALTRTRLSGPGTVHTPLFDEDRVAAVSARSPLAHRSSIDWLDLADESIVVNTVSGTTQADSWPAEHRPTRIVTCGNYDEWLHLVATGGRRPAAPAGPARATGCPTAPAAPAAPRVRRSTAGPTGTALVLSCSLPRAARLRPSAAADTSTVSWCPDALACRRASASPAAVSALRAIHVTGVQ